MATLYPIGMFLDTTGISPAKVFSEKKSPLDDKHQKENRLN